MKATPTIPGISGKYLNASVFREITTNRSGNTAQSRTAQMKYASYMRRTAERNWPVTKRWRSGIAITNVIIDH